MKEWRQWQNCLKNRRRPLGHGNALYTCDQQGHWLGRIPTPELKNHSGGMTDPSAAQASIRTRRLIASFQPVPASRLRTCQEATTQMRDVAFMIRAKQQESRKLRLAKNESLDPLKKFRGATRAGGLARLPDRRSMPNVLGKTRNMHKVRHLAPQTPTADH